MKHLTATALGIALTAAAGAASAQQYPSYPSSNYPSNNYPSNTYPSNGYPSNTYGSQAPAGAMYDYARVIRTTPVYDSRGTYAANTGGQRCVESRTYAGGYGDGRYVDPNDRNGDGYQDEYYSGSGYGDPRYGDNRYGSNGYGSNGYGNQYGGSQMGNTAATVIGSIVGAVVGSQVGGGSARYATSAIGTMVGGMAGRQIYQQTQRQRTPQRVGRVVACDPMPVGAYQSGRNVSMYDVTYEYAGRQYTTRTSYDPGARIRVRVDVRPE